MQYELKVIKAGKSSVVTWEGSTPEAAIARYLDCVREEQSVIAWREANRHGIHVGLWPIIE